MTIFILTCTNQEGTVVSLDVHYSLESAHTDMAQKHHAETRELKEAGHYKASRDYIERCAATVGDDEVFYKWQIWPKGI